MKRRSLALAALFALVSSGCAMSGNTGDRTTASAQLQDARGAIKARATAEQAGDAVRIRLDASGMPAGTYAAHVHTTGACAAPDFTSAGPHWNPTGAQHGKDNPAGMHKGDLPNLEVRTDGRGRLEYLIEGATLAGGSAPLLDADGAAVVVHAQLDDHRTDPSGNAGARIACGVLG
jgi:Cu-Zn family superoxide dismutase